MRLWGSSVHMIGTQIFLSTEIPVGASLLAKAVGQSTSMLNVSTHSRAGSLPQEISGVWGLSGGYGLGRGIGEIEYFAALGGGELLGLAFEQERA